ncbi:phage terminase large subunit [Defluviimonas sp. SAOS-178_SWC]|uniref:phage terminase large subunit n=1 Tax=Defluviimonas sp. SAOS-178_SWC TaxID=3121287 RepID=UPI0032214CF4
MTRLDPALERQVVDAICRQDFLPFLWRAFGTLHAGRTEGFVANWHIEAMCHELDRLRRGENLRLVINVPPRHLKSITVSVAFVAFLLGHNPAAKVIAASYGLDLGRKHSEDCRRIMEADWYRRVFPGTRLAQRGNTNDEIRTTRGGSRKAVSLGGAVTGHGADYIIIDDLLKASDATSETELQNARDYIQSSLLSRLDDPAKGRVVMIAQRLHERDPAGFLLESGTYHHLNLRAIAETDEAVPIGRGRVHHRKTGEALFPAKMDLETLARMRREMGSVVFNCQYQQNPTAADGSPLRWEWFGSYEKAPSRSAFEMLVQSWDTASSADPNAAFSVCTTWGFRERKWWLLDVFRARLEYPELKRKCLAMAEDWAADLVLIEKASSGVPLLQDCRLVHRGRFQASTPETDKERRFRAACAPVSEGLVLLPLEAPWLPSFRQELLAFPRGAFKDQVDSFSQMMNWATSGRFYAKLSVDHPIIAERRAIRSNRPRPEGRYRG